MTVLTVFPVIQEAVIGVSQSETRPSKNIRPYLKNERTGAWLK
jgi:hypothetical protein